MDNLKTYGWDQAKNPPGCQIWTDPSHALYADLQRFLHELEVYQDKVDNFTDVNVDLRDLIRDPTNNHDTNTICQTVNLGGAQGLLDLFPSRQLSQSSSGYIEPLTTPMRHPQFCNDPKTYLMDMRYMVHDFEYMCRQLQPHSRTILIDMGASLSYHNDQANKDLHVRLLIY